MSVLYCVTTYADVPAGDAWLAAGERARLAAMPVPKRRADFRLGRFAAKRALALLLRDPRPLSQIEIRAADDGAPEAWLDGSPLPIALSLSHSGGLALCAFAAGGSKLGCDIEGIEPRSASFVADCLTTEERAALDAATAEARQELVSVFWSAKESSLKALRTGLRRDVRSVTVRLTSSTCAGGWRRMALRCESDPELGANADIRLSGYWRRLPQVVVTVACELSQIEPVELLFDNDSTSRGFGLAALADRNRSWSTPYDR